jgi:drug/metabolite transporter (DMT)-like permease
VVYTPAHVPGSARLALLAACFLWAVSFVATKVALASTPPLSVVALRLVISAACFVVWIAATGRTFRIGGTRQLVRLLGLSLLGTGLHYGIQTIGLEYTTASNASLYAVTGPITIVVLAAIFLHEPVGTRKVVGIVLAVLGVLTVMGIDTLSRADLGGHVLGDALVLGSIVLWGMFTVFGKKLTDELGALRVTAVVTIIGATWMLPVGWIEARLRSFSLVRVTVDGWVAIAFLGIGCSFLATLLYFMALERTESQKVGVYLYTIPPMTAVVAALYLHEVLTPRFFLGSLLVFGGVWLTERG